MNHHSGDSGNGHDQSGNLPSDQFERNLALLARTELGSSLVPIYEAAVEYDERLANVELVAIDQGAPDHALAIALPNWDIEHNQSGRHQIHMRLDDTERTLELFHQNIQRLPLSYSIICERAGIDPATITPAIFIRLALLHELGHVSVGFEGMGQEGYETQRATDMASLPVPNIPASVLVDDEARIRRWVRHNRDELRETYGIETYEALVELQQERYRVAQTEFDADIFVGHFLEAHPDIKASLT